MSVEPYAARTVIIRSVLPPKPEPKKIIPAMSLEADARRCNARLRRVMGATQEGVPGRDANARRMEEAAARNSALANAVLALLADGEMRRSEITARLNLTNSQSRSIMTGLKLSGQATFRKGPDGLAIWRAE
jgi:hypothetical protein